MQSHTHRLFARPVLEEDVEALDQLVHSRFGRAVRVPASGRVVGDGAHPGGHESEDGGRGEWGGVVCGEDGSDFFREERAEVLEEEHGAECVDLECLQRVGVGDLRWGFLRVEDAWDAEGEVEIVFLGGEAGAAVGGCRGDAVFV